MNESDFENELRAQRPAAPSPQLAERIAGELTDLQPASANGALVPLRAQPVAHLRTADVVKKRAPAPFAWLRSLGWVCTGALAVFAVLVLTHMPDLSRSPDLAGNPPPLADASDFQPAEESSELVAAEDQGFVFDEDQTPQRQVRLTYVERHSWTNPATGAVLEFEIPREDIVLMPVAMQ